MDSTLLSNGDQVYLTPSGDYDKVLLTLKTSDGSTKEVTFKKGDPLAYTYDGSDVVSFSVNATKNGQQVARYCFALPGRKGCSS